MAGDDAPAPAARGADLRFILPVPPKEMLVVPPSPALAAAIGLAGIDAAVGSTRDTVVVERRHLDDVLTSEATALVVLGRVGARPLRRAGWHVEHHVVRGGHRRPRVIAPVRSAHAMRFVLGRRPLPASQRVVRRVGGWLARRGIIGRDDGVTIATRTPGPPALVAAAVGAGADAAGGWVLLLGEGDDLQRALFVLFAGDGTPSHVVKFGRTPAGRRSLDADAVGLALLAGAGTAVAARGPRIITRLEVGGVPATVETAGRGVPLSAVLLGGADVEPIIDTVATWLLDLATETRVAPDALTPELIRLGDDVLSGTAAAAVGPALLAAVASSPGVVAHNDLGTWNILYDAEAGFTVVDWESARRPALPLWDLLYFVTDALVVAGGRGDRATKARRAVAVLRGEDARSPLLFGWVDRFVDELGLDRASVGAVATLCWLHHAGSPLRRAYAGGTGDAPGHLARVGAAWMDDPRLGPGWPAFEEHRRR